VVSPPIFYSGAGLIATSYRYIAREAFFPFFWILAYKAPSWLQFCGNNWLNFLLCFSNDKKFVDCILWKPNKNSCLVKGTGTGTCLKVHHGTGVPFTSGTGTVSLFTWDTGTGTVPALLLRELSVPVIPRSCCAGPVSDGDLPGQREPQADAGVR